MVVAPFVAFTVYWGASLTGMLREGLQSWVTLVVVVTVASSSGASFPWLASKLVRAILSLRAGELLVVALVPALCTVGVSSATA